MAYFNEILAIGDQLSRSRRSDLFSMPSNVEPRPAEHVQVRVSRCFLGTIGVGEVISTGHDTLVTEPAGATLIVPLSGRLGSAEIGGVEHSARVGQALLFSPNRRRTRVEPQKSGQFVGVPIVFPRSDLFEAAAEIGVPLTGRRGLDRFALSVSAGASQAVRDMIALAGNLHGDLSRGDPRLSHAHSQRSWSKRLTGQMLEVLQLANAVDLPAVDLGRAAERHARNARDFMEAHFTNIVTMYDVAEVCGISVRTLEVSFRETWGQTPYQALNEIRMAAARRRLLNPRVSSSVTEIALEAGFGHLGRFSVAYRKRFDESPSHTLRRSHV